MNTYVMNAWYPLGWSRDIGNELSPRTVLEERIVAFRAQDGKVAALEDLCPHRLLPLSMGALKNGAVECGYHGMTFDCAGRCVRVPGQKTIPPHAQVRAYPVHENMGLAWIWMGTPELADPSKVFDLPQYHDPAWHAVEGDALRFGANYLSLADNLCDPSHVSFVHRTTLGNAYSEDIPVQHEERDGRLVTWRWIIDAPAIPLFAKYGAYQGNVDRWHFYNYYPPGIAIVDLGTALTGTGAPKGRRDDCMQIYACHFLTPIDAETTIDHWLYVKNFRTDDETTQALSDDLRFAFDEDKAVLEAIQANERRLPGYKTVKTAIDASPRRMRSMVDAMIEAERG